MTLASEANILSILKVIYEKAKSINISSYTEMQLNVDGEYGGKLPANFLNLERHIDVFTPHDIHNEELLDQPTVTPQMKAEDYQHNSEDEVYKYLRTQG